MKNWKPFLCLAVMFFSLTVSSCAAGGSASGICPTKDVFDAFVEDEIRRAVEEDSVWCCWDESTQWFDCLALYDCDDNCNGYVYKMKTDGEETGYIQVNFFDGELSVGCSSYKGKPAYESMVDNAMEQIQESFSGKLYFFGGFAYCVKTGPDTFKAINGVDETDISFAKEYYEDFLTRRRAALREMDV